MPAATLNWAGNASEERLGDCAIFAMRLRVESGIGLQSCLPNSGAEVSG